jgi:hypothetical protein
VTRVPGVEAVRDSSSVTTWAVSRGLGPRWIVGRRDYHPFIRTRIDGASRRSLMCRLPLGWLIATIRTAVWYAGIHSRLIQTETSSAFTSTASSSFRLNERIYEAALLACALGLVFGGVDQFMKTVQYGSMWVVNPRPIRRCQLENDAGFLSVANLQRGCRKAE